MNENANSAPSPRAERTPITIKKYANRRLYNTATSTYVTLDNLATMVKAGADFVVYDAKTGEDITRSVLTHIIVEEESKGQKLLPVSFLRHLISFYGDSLQVLVPRYLEHTMHAFAHNQERMRDYIREALDGLMPFGQFEEMSKQNMAIFDTAMKMFSPFYPGQAEADEEQEGQQGNHRQGAAVAASIQIDELRSRLNEMQKQLDDLVSRRRSG
jgi:polyhydroxyalkanoate synthesis repressor PhaR